MRAQWKLTLEAAKAEAVLAADLYNQAKRPRRVEGYFVHMHMAWLYLFLALHQRDKLPYHHHRLSNAVTRGSKGNRRLGIWRSSAASVDLTTARSEGTL